jgi:rhamnosyltransferase
MFMTIRNIKTAVLIPTFNAGENWLKTLESIDSQKYSFERKIIVDSDSNDGTIELAKSFGWEILSIAKVDFNHGATRQLLVDTCNDVDICVFLTQDAILATIESVENLVNVFVDKQIGMVYGRQLPHQNAKPLEIHARLFNYPSNTQVRSFEDKDVLGFKVFFCSNSFSAYRRTALINAGGFPSDSIMGEDAIVSAKMLINGFKIAYVANAMVYHSHSYTLTEEFKRYFDTRVFHEQNKWLIENYGKPTGEGLKFVRSEIKYAYKSDKRSLPKSIISIFAKWLGYNMGQFYKVIPRYFLTKLSMHKYYWK